MTTEQPSKTAYEQLPRRQRRFVDEYCTGISGAEAARRSGSKSPRPAAAAYKLLQNHQIKSAIDEKRQDILAAVGVRQEQIVREHARIAFFDERNLYKEDGSLKDPKDWDDETAAVIAGVDVEDLFEGRGKDTKRVGTLHKVRTWDKQKSLDALGRISGIDKQKIDLNATGMTPPIVQLVRYDDHDTPDEPSG